jgi:PAS domain S-box-containing protein
LTFPTLDRHLEIASLSGEVRAVMAGIVDGLMEFEGVDGASLSTVDGDLAHFMVCAGADLPLEGQTMPLDETLGIECVHRSEVTVLRTTTGPEVSRCLTPGAGSIVLAPIEYDGAIRGILGVRSADTDAFDSHEVELIAQLSRGAAIALRNAELVERLAGSERQYRELHAQAADATLVGSIDGDLTDANDAASALLWYSTGELTGINVRSLLAEERTDISSARPAASAPSGARTARSSHSSTRAGSSTTGACTPRSATSASASETRNASGRAWGSCTRSCRPSRRSRSSSSTRTPSPPRSSSGHAGLRAPTESPCSGSTATTRSSTTHRAAPRRTSACGSTAARASQASPR